MPFHNPVFLYPQHNNDATNIVPAEMQ